MNATTKAAKPQLPRFADLPPIVQMVWINRANSEFSALVKKATQWEEEHAKKYFLITTGLIWAFGPLGIIAGFVMLNNMVNNRYRLRSNRAYRRYKRLINESAEADRATRPAKTRSAAVNAALAA